MTHVTLRSDTLSVRISSQGAEMQSIKTAAGLELLWQADPAVWARHAPHLFPIVGRLKNNALHHEGKSYQLSQHGFARDLPFVCESSSDGSCTMLLKDSEQTREHYPFAFELRITHRLQNNALEIIYVVRNPAASDLLCSVGTHPAFAWPLSANADRAQHKLVFDQAEPAPIRRLHGGLVKSETYPTPVQGREMPLSDALFVDDVIFFDSLKSRSLKYIAPDVAGAPVIHIDFKDFPHLGIWTKPGAPFVCIEPWQGHASPQEFDGEFRDKPGVASIAARQERVWRYTIAVE